MSRELMLDIKNHMERRFPVGQSTEHRYAVTGEPYVTFGTSAVKKEGEYDSVLCRDVSTAEELFISAFDKYASGKDGVLYWRSFPSIYEVSYFDAFLGVFERFYGIRARFLVSSKEPLPENELADLLSPAAS